MNIIRAVFLLVVVSAALACQAPRGPYERRGSVNLVQWPSDAGVQSFISAVFTKVDPPGWHCSAEQLGACELSRCEVTTDAGSAAMPALVSAGDLTVSGTEQGALAIAAPAGGAYDFSFSLGKSLWSAAGQTITVAAGGAEVPAFRGAVTTPGPGFVRQAPLCPSGTCPAASKSKELSIEWAWSDASGVVRATLVTGDEHHSAMLSCDAPASAGRMRIADSAMGQLLTTPRALLFVSPRRSTHLTVGEWLVELQAIEQTDTSAGIEITP